jgi:hypothetical protein
MSRYEAALWRQVRQNLVSLQRLDRRRLLERTKIRPRRFFESPSDLETVRVAELQGQTS